MPFSREHFNFDALFSTVADKVTAALATGAIVSPLWLAPLKQISDIAAILAPILGSVWLAVQIIVKIIEVRRG